MNIILTILLLLSQAPAPLPVGPPPSVVIGLLDQQKLVLENPHFTGFIESREGGEAFLLYKQAFFQGEISVRALSRVDFGEYKKDTPFAMTITLKNGEKLQV